MKKGKTNNPKRLYPSANDLNFRKGTYNYITSIEVFGNEVYPLVKKIASERWRMDRKTDYEDMIGAVLVGLAKAISKYNPKAKVKLVTYAFPKMYYGALDQLRSETRYAKLFDVVDPVALFDENQEDPFDMTDHLNIAQLFKKVIRVVETKLSGPHAVALVRRHFEEATDEVIAKELGVPPDDVVLLIEGAIREVRRFFPNVRL